MEECENQEVLTPQWSSLGLWFIRGEVQSLHVYRHFMQGIQCRLIGWDFSSKFIKRLSYLLLFCKSHLAKTSFLQTSEITFFFGGGILPLIASSERDRKRMKKNKYKRMTGRSKEVCPPKKNLTLLCLPVEYVYTHVPDIFCHKPHEDRATIFPACAVFWRQTSDSWI